MAEENDVAILLTPDLKDGRVGYAQAARIPLGGDAAAVQKAGRAAIDALRQAGNGNAGAAVRVVVALPASSVLRKQIVLPALITSVSTASHWPTLPEPTKSTASEIVTSDLVQPITSAQL